VSNFDTPEALGCVALGYLEYRVSRRIGSKRKQNGGASNAKGYKHGGQGRNRTADASLFRAALYQLSYLARIWLVASRVRDFGWAKKTFSASIEL
jgi:hypothetical protein